MSSNVFQTIKGRVMDGDGNLMLLESIMKIL